MSLFLPNIPAPSDNLDFSQPELLSNNQGLDTVFGIDHTKFSNASSNKGFHNKVTTAQFVANTEIPPIFPTIQPTTTTNPILYAYQPTDGAGNPTTNLGLLQYSMGPSNAVPSPITTIQSSSVLFTIAAGGGTANVFNFAGMPRASCILLATGFITAAAVQVGCFATAFWNGSTILLANIAAGANLRGLVAGSTLQLQNSGVSNTDNVFWTLQFLRTQ